MNRRRFKGMALVILMIGAALISGCKSKPAEEEALTLKMESGEKLAFRKVEQGGEAASATLKFVVTPDAKGYLFQSPDLTLQARIKESKIKIYGPDGKLRLKIKKEDDKIKILRSEEDPSAWSIRFKMENSSYKVKQGETEIGKAKFYADRKVIKVKDSSGKVLARMSSDKPRSAAAVALLTDLKGEERLVLYALLLLREL